MFSNTAHSKTEQNVNLISGIIVPCLAQMLGVIFYLRLGWIISGIGLAKILVVIALCFCLLLITTLSISSIISNMKIREGGSYYILSRSIGLEMGSAIAVILIVSHIIAIAFCISAFAISFQELYPHLSTFKVELTTALTLGLIVLMCPSTISKMQFIIASAVLFSFASLLLGKHSLQVSNPLILQKIPFWEAFALFFPAAAGLESMLFSYAQLKNPKKNLPIGLLWALGIAFSIYILFSCYIHLFVSYNELWKNPLFICQHSFNETWILMGIWSATLSTAISGINGCSKLIQALSKDRLIFKGTLYKSPFFAVAITTFLTICMNALTDLNHIISIFTTTSLVFYAMVNLVCFIESSMENPSWNPSWVVPKRLSFFGFLASLVCIFLIHSHAFIVFFIFLWVVYLTIHSHAKGSHFDDMRYSFLLYFCKIIMQKMKHLKMTGKTWRPHLLLITPIENNSKALEFTNILNANHSFLTHFILENKHSSRLSSINYHDNFEKTIYTNNYKLEAKHIISHYGLGPLEPNTVVLPYNLQFFSNHQLYELIYHIYNKQKNALVIKTNTDHFSQINLWWGGIYRKNLDLSLALIKLLQTNLFYQETAIHICVGIKNTEEKEPLQEQFNRYYSLVKVKNLKLDLIQNTSLSFYQTLSARTLANTLTFVGIRAPFEDELYQDYKTYLDNLFIGTAPIQNVIYILAGEKLNFLKIFIEK